MGPGKTYDLRAQHLSVGLRVTTVDGSEIRRSPVEVGSLSVYPIIYKVLYIPGGAGFLPSTVVNDHFKVFDENQVFRYDTRSVGEQYQWYQDPIP